jgi:hypothetical protein
MISVHIFAIVLALIAIGLHLINKRYQKHTNDLVEFDIDQARGAYNALMEDFNNYQVKTDRKIIELEKQIEIKSSQANKAIEKIHKGLPGKIRGVIGHIEFSQNNLR